jgi:hypothetical protein
MFESSLASFALPSVVALALQAPPLLPVHRCADRARVLATPRAAGHARGLVTFNNLTDEPIKVAVIAASSELPPTTMRPGTSYLTTRGGSAWVVRDGAGRCLGVVVTGAQGGAVMITRGVLLDARGWVTPPVPPEQSTPLPPPVQAAGPPAPRTSVPPRRATGPDELAFSDGSIWHQSGAALRRVDPSPELRISFEFHQVGIGCAAGGGTSYSARPVWLPPAFAGATTGRTQDGRVLVAACADIASGVTEVLVSWPGPASLRDRDAASVRTVLEEMLDVARGISTPASVALFSPVRARVPLTAATGNWRFITDKTTDTKAMLISVWPRPATPVGLFLTYSPGPQTCSSTGLEASAFQTPGWIRNFYSRALRQGSFLVVCGDTRKGHVLMVEIPDERLGTEERGRTAALLAAALEVL